MPILLRIKRESEELEAPKSFTASPQGLVEAAKALIVVREQAKMAYGDVDVYVELTLAGSVTRISQPDLDYILYSPTAKAGRSALNTRLPSERTVQRGTGPMNRAAEVLGQG